MKEKHGLHKFMLGKEHLNHQVNVGNQLHDLGLGRQNDPKTSDIARVRKESERHKKIHRPLDTGLPRYV